jgi:hypothetical protein
MLARLSALLAPSPRKRSRAASRADGATRTFFYAAVVIVAAITLVIVFQQTWSSSPRLTDLPVLRMDQALPPGPGSTPPAADGAGASTAGAGGAAQPAPEWFTIRASVYNGSEKGLQMAFAAQAELVVRGLPQPTVVGHEDPEEAGVFQTYELVVGVARTTQALEATLERLLAIDDWPGGAAAPFVDATIVPHPSPQSVQD